MIIVRWFLQVFDKAEDAIVFIICLLFISLGIYSVIDSYLIYAEALDTSILKFKPGYEEFIGDDDKQILSSRVAWLTLDDTEIDYPVMQGLDNIEFLNKNPFGEYSLSGSIFLDYRNNKDFTDEYSIIYGHHMQNAMFGFLDHYMENGYLEKHDKGTLIVGSEKIRLQLFAALNAEATDDIIFSPSSTRKDIMEYVNKNSLVRLSSEVVDDDERLFALSTCKYPDSLTRTVVIGKYNASSGKDIKS